MDRIVISNENEKVLPMTINGKDIDLKFNVGDMLTSSIILGMADQILDYQAEGEKLAEIKEKGKAQIKVYRKFADKGLALCESLSKDMARVFPQWAEIVKDAFISIADYENIIFKVAELINRKKIEDKVSKQIEDER